MNLCDLARRQAQLRPDALAVKDFHTSITYGELERLTQRFAQNLASCGVGRGDRVGFWLEKTVSTVAVMQSILRLNAAYVPLDPLSPAARIDDIIQDCHLKAVVTTRSRREKLATVNRQALTCLSLENDRLIDDQPQAVSRVVTNLSEHEGEMSADTELAYVLYTSGSTGKPKGVCMSHGNALAFIEWAVSELEPGARDRFANHAPFHFDISVLDLYVAFSVGAMVFLISDTIAYMPVRVVDCIVQEELTIWYSVPSALILMMEQGGLLAHTAISLRFILFAGESFPLKEFQKLYRRWPHIRFLNLYGPTETNVCTCYEITSLPQDHIPIGRACSGDRVWSQKDDGTVVQPGEIGELMVEGPTVMLGYWGQHTQESRPYATGDLVRQQEDGNYIYLGRRDHMVKVRGHRIELAEIEAVLAQHPAVLDVVVLVVEQKGYARLLAFLVADSEKQRPSLLDMKRYCAERLPRYMIVDTVCFLSTLPRTRNGKIDRLALSQMGRDQEKGQNDAKR